METKIKVCDALPGSGKTVAAIAEMNKRTDKKYVFITPYLDEVQRIISNCPDRHFVTPDATNVGTKLSHFISLVRSGENVASTHALFERYDEETLDAIERGEYTLVLDEVVNPVEVLDITKSDIDFLTKNNLVEINSETDEVTWAMDNYSGKFNKLKNIIRSGHVFYDGETLMVWNLPLRLFTAFKEVIVLTYMFDAQILSYYFKSHNIQVEYISVAQEDGEYYFSVLPNFVKPELPKINIVENPSVNKIGDKRTALSVSWYKKDRVKNTKAVQKAIYYVVRSMFKVKTSQCLWTTFAAFQDDVKGKGYGKAFATCSMRATNKWSDRTHLVYAVNRFVPPSLVRYFQAQGITVDQDAWALSEMIQWIWRSAIRRGEEICIYVPSSRMRTLLKGWIAGFNS